MTKFLGRAHTVDELIEMIKPYSGFNIFLEGCDYNSPEVCIYLNEEEKTIELNQQNLYLTFSRNCVIINMLSGENKAIVLSGAQREWLNILRVLSRYNNEFVEDSVKCRQRATTL